MKQVCPYTMFLSVLISSSCGSAREGSAYTGEGSAYTGSAREGSAYTGEGSAYTGSAREGLASTGIRKSDVAVIGP